MNDRNEALASAPFAFSTPAPRPIDATDAVNLFLHAVYADRTGKTALLYAGDDLRNLIEQGGAPNMGAVLHENTPFAAFEVGPTLGSDGGYNMVYATLAYGQPAEFGGQRIFQVSDVEGSWKCMQVGWTKVQPRQPAARLISRLAKLLQPCSIC